MEEQMNKYKVKLKISAASVVYVDADDEVEAIEIAESEIKLTTIDEIKVEEAQEICFIPQIQRVA